MKNKKWIKILVIVCGVIVVLGFLKNILIKTAITLGSEKVVGAKVSIKSLSVGILTSSVHVKGFKLYNPKGFPNEPMMDITEIRVDYDLGALLKGKLHLPLVILRLNEMVVVKNKEGELNVDALKVSNPAAKEQKGVEDKSKKPAPKIDMQIDVAKLDLGKVVVKDYTKSDVPTVNVYDIGVHDKTFKDIKSAEQFATLIIVQGMGPTTIQGAKVYAAAAILGVGFLPAGIAGVLIGNDGGNQEFNADLTKAYAVTLSVLKKMGEVSSEDKENGLIKGKINGADITIRIAKGTTKKTQILVTARKYMIPKPEVAQGLLYQVAEILK